MAKCFIHLGSSQLNLLRTRSQSNKLCFLSSAAHQTQQLTRIRCLWNISTALSAQYQGISKLRAEHCYRDTVLNRSINFKRHPELTKVLWHIRLTLNREKERKINKTEPDVLVFNNKTTYILNKCMRLHKINIKAANIKHSYTEILTEKRINALKAKNKCIQLCLMC